MSFYGQYLNSQMAYQSWNPIWCSQDWTILLNVSCWNAIHIEKQSKTSKINMTNIILEPIHILSISTE